MTIVNVKFRGFFIMGNNIKKFICKKCGACCQNLHLTKIYAELDDGTGTCIYFDKNSKLCRIYEERPLLCRVDDAYECFKDILSYEDYLELNYQSCELLIKQQKTKEEK